MTLGTPLVDNSEFHRAAISAKPIITVMNTTDLMKWKHTGCVAISMSASVYVSLKVQRRSKNDETYSTRDRPPCSQPSFSVHETMPRNRSGTNTASHTSCLYESIVPMPYMGPMCAPTSNARTVPANVNNGAATQLARMDGPNVHITGDIPNVSNNLFWADACIVATSPA